MRATRSCSSHRHSRLATSRKPGFGAGLTDSLLVDRLPGLARGAGLAELRLGALMLLARVAVDGLLVGRLGLVRRPLAFVQRIGRLVQPGDRRIPTLGQLADAIIGLLRQ